MYCMVIATCQTLDEAKKLASEIVEKRLAACVQLSPVTSIYDWEGKTCNEPEIRLVMKTRTGLYTKLEAHILATHSYEVPQIVKVPIEGGYGPYLDWIDASTDPGTESG